MTSVCADDDGPRVVGTTSLRVDGFYPIVRVYHPQQRVRSPKPGPWDNVVDLESTDFEVTWVRRPDGSGIDAAIRLRPGQDPSVLPDWRPNKTGRV